MRGMRIIKPKGRVFAPMTNANLPWVDGSKSNIVFAALQELASFGADAHAIIPGIGSINGLTAQNYLDNFGTTPATVDGLIGLMLDDMGTVIVPAVGDFGVAAGYDNVLSLVTSSSFTSTAGAANCRVYVNLSTVVGGTYTISGTFPTAGAAGVVVYSRSGSNGAGTTINNTAVIASGGSFTLSFTATTTTSCFLFISNAAGQSFTSSGLQLLTGIHATQATPANKPVLRKGAVNLLTYSEDFSNAAWSKANTAATVNKLTESAATSTHYILHTTATTVVGVTYTYQVLLKAAERSWAIVGQNSLGTGYFFVNLSTGTFGFTHGTYISRSITADTDGYWKVTITYSAASIASTGCVFISAGDTIVSYTGDGTSGIYIKNAQLQLGTVDNPYALTTTAPASNGIGNSYLEFDGVNDYLSLSAVPFQMSDDFFVVVGALVQSAVNSALFSFGDTANTNSVFIIGNSTTNKVRVYFKDSLGTTVDVSSVSNMPATNCVVTLRKVGSTVTARVNGVVVLTTTVSMTSFTSNVATIGALTRNIMSDFLKGNIYTCKFGKGAITDAQLLTLEKFAGLFGGITI